MEVAPKSQVEALEKRVNELEAVIRGLANKISPVSLVPIEIAQKMLDCSRVTLYRKVKSGEIQAVKTGKRVRVSTESIKAHLIKCGIEPTVAEFRTGVGFFA